MGIMDLEGMDVPDNKGGRPPKEEEEQDSDRGLEHAYTPALDSEEWWRERVKEHVFLGELAGMDMEECTEAIARISGDTAVDPITVRKKLSKHGIYETDWTEYIKWRREVMPIDDWYDVRIPEGEVGPEISKPVSSSTSSSRSSLRGKFSGTDDDDDDELDTNSGLGGLLKDAKNGS